MGGAALSVAGGSVFQSNRAEESGGALFVTDSAIVTLSKCEMRSNSASEGGGIYAKETRSDVLRVALDSEVVLFNNTAASNGGGVAATGRNIELELGHAVRFERNRANVSGGGIFLVDCRRFHSNNTLFVHNEAFSGGGVYVEVTAL